MWELPSKTDTDDGWVEIDTWFDGGNVVVVVVVVVAGTVVVVVVVVGAIVEVVVVDCGTVVAGVGGGGVATAVVDKVSRDVVSLSVFEGEIGVVLECGGPVTGNLCSPKQDRA